MPGLWLMHDPTPHLLSLHDMRWANSLLRASYTTLENKILFIMSARFRGASRSTKYTLTFGE